MKHLRPLEAIDYWLEFPLTKFGPKTKNGPRAQILLKRAALSFHSVCACLGACALLHCVCSGERAVWYAYQSAFLRTCNNGRAAYSGKHVGAFATANLRKDYRTMKTKANALHTNVVAIFNAYTSAAKAEGSEHATMVKLLRVMPLNDAEAVKVVRDDLLTTFGETHKDAAQIRINIMNNARRVAYGGTKDGKAIRGKGAAAMLEVCESVASIRELKKALAEAVPDALKSERGGDRKSKKSAKKTGNPVAVPKVATREEAFAAARKILEFCMDKFIKPSETELTEMVKRTCAALA